MEHVHGRGGIIMAKLSAIDAKFMKMDRKTARAIGDMNTPKTKKTVKKTGSKKK